MKFMRICLSDSYAEHSNYDIYACVCALLVTTPVYCTGSWNLVLQLTQTLLSLFVFIFVGLFWFSIKIINYTKLYSTQWMSFENYF
jgi:hypothetical protein